MEKLDNIHPGEVLNEEFLIPMEISAYRLAKDTFIPQTRISEIIKGRRKITADTALRLAKYFGTSAKFWLGLQDDFDAEDLDDVSMDELEADVHITGDESLDFADDMDRGGIEDVVAASEVAKKKGGSLKFVAPVAVLLIAAGVGGYIVTNPDILGGGNETTVVAPSIVAPPSLSDDIAALDTDVPQPVASENEVPRMPESGDEGLASH